MLTTQVSGLEPHWSLRFHRGPISWKTKEIGTCISFLDMQIALEVQGPRPRIVCTANFQPRRFLYPLSAHTPSTHLAWPKAMTRRSAVLCCRWQDSNVVVSQFLRFHANSLANVRPGILSLRPPVWYTTRANVARTQASTPHLYSHRALPPSYGQSG